MSDVSSITTIDNECQNDTDANDSATAPTEDRDFESISLRGSEFTSVTTKVESSNTRLIWKDLEQSTTRSQRLRQFARFTWSRYGDNWYPETAALCLSFICTFAMVICLQKFDGKPAPRIPLFKLTLNAIISILATTSKVSLMFIVSNSIGQTKWVWFSKRSRSLLDAEIFDDASRGPWGSLRLLSAKTRWSLASIGSFLTLLALVYDPFVQQIIVLQPRLDHSPMSNTLFPKLTALEVGANDLISIAALNAGLWGHVGMRNAICPEPSCNWDPFQSIEWCSTCQVHNTSFEGVCSFANVSSNMDSSNTSSWSKTCAIHSDSVLIQTFDIQLSGATQPEQRVYLNGSDSGFTVVSPSIATISFPQYQIVKLDETFGDVNTRAPITGDSEPILLSRSPMMRFASIAIDYDLNSTKLQFPSVTECSLELCTGQMNATVRDNVVTADSVGTLRTGSWSRQLQPLAQLQANAEWAPNDWYFCWTPDNEEFFKIGTGTRVSNTITSANVNSTAFCIPPPPDGFWDWSSNLPSMNASQLTLSVYFNQSHPADSKNLSSALADTNYIVQTIMTTGLSETAQNLASAITQSALQKASSYVYGYGESSISYVHVRSIWLIMPVLLPCVSLFFFVAVMLESYYASTPLWKSSVNALLYHGLDHLTEVDTPLKKVSQLDAQASLTSARLAPIDRNSRLGLETSYVRVVP